MEYIEYATYYYIFLGIITVIALWFKAEEQVEEFIKKEKQIKREYSFIFDK
jgi:hypothetical protein